MDRRPLPQGDRYEGQWLNDREHGQGTYTFAEGNKYAGEWRDGVRNGCAVNLV